MSSRTLPVLLGSGIAAGVLVPALLWADGATRPGYSLWHHGASQLGTGERGWLQTINFVLGGLLLAAFAAGVRGTLRGGRGGTWGPLLLAATAAGLLVAGLVPTDPALGYPPGQATAITASGRIHQVAGFLLFFGLSGAAFALARRLGETSRGWAVYSRLSGAIVIVAAFAAGIAYRLDILNLWQPAPAGLLEHLSLLAGFCWLIAVSMRLRGMGRSRLRVHTGTDSSGATGSPPAAR
ncbi:DUF998 domain-containing protein [Nonomuraea turkmeniaca]|uniref:DUF998 domain-containing protein n=1 Tax=Nonomuraea turkmeniaca TaxID=103838 RepID=A0A5S4FIL3_9ACTN|nr:DUF998 domain-containing protein [Nonomuraea turkmeniaca]TMR20558.1 DUF998 domain-containing protein [Nonomuraea turkmeniaca]